MKTIVHVVKVMCLCGWWITIRGAAGTVKVCWKCGRVAGFALRGAGKVVGIVKDSDGTHQTKGQHIWSSR